MKKTTYIYIAVGVLIVAGIIYLLTAPGKPGTYDAFAQCINDSGTTFYGAFWCPHCRAQKEEFGKSAQYLPYVECSTPDGQSQDAVCNAAGIQSYPTWVFPDSSSATGYSTTTGVLSLETLSQKTSCSLPNGVSASDTSVPPAASGTSNANISASSSATSSLSASTTG